MASQHDLWSRVFTYIPTPTREDGAAIDEGRLRETIDYQIENGIDGVCVLGSTGGNGSFSDDEMMAATAVAAKHVESRVALVAGTGARTTQSCIRLTKHAHDVGCDGVMILPVSYWPLTQDEVLSHYDHVARAVDIPIAAYNNPWTTGVDMKPELIARLAQLDNIRCVKESSGDLTRITAIRLLTDKLTIIAGWESTSFEAFAVGATAWAPVCSNFVPQAAIEFYRAAVDEADMPKARKLWDRLFPLCEFICAKSHIRVAHTGLDIVGRSAGAPRRPLRMLGAEDRTRLHGILKAVGAKGV
jgi:4-hydroxy-tetrahydrodipicolinate synthase